MEKVYSIMPTHLAGRVRDQTSREAGSLADTHLFNRNQHPESESQTHERTIIDQLPFPSSHTPGTPPPMARLPPRRPKPVYKMVSRNASCVKNQEGLSEEVNLVMRPTLSLCPNLSNLNSVQGTAIPST